MPRLTEQEQQEIVRFIEAGKPVGRVEQRETRRFKFARALRIICLDMLGFTSFYPTYDALYPFTQ
jgi:hypothetical protein